MEHVVSLLLRSIFTDNMVFAFFLGMCSYLAVSKNVKTSLGLGVAVIFVLCVTVPVDYLLQTKVLGASGIFGEDLTYLSFILFIAVIAGIVQLDGQRHLTSQASAHVAYAEYIGLFGCYRLRLLRRHPAATE